MQGKNVRFMNMRTLMKFLGLCLVWAATSGRSAYAAYAEFDLTMANDRFLLYDQNNPQYVQMALCKSSLEIAAANGTPWFLLKNLSTTAGITDFAITLRNPNATFDAITPQNSGGAVVSPVDGGVKGGITSNVLHFHFANPLAAGAYYMFQAQLTNGAGMGNMLPDYRYSLFNLDGSNATVADLAQNAVASVNFTTPGLAEQIVLPNFSEDTGQVTSPISSGATTAFSGGHYGKGIQTFFVDPGTRLGVAAPVPEPSSWVLMGLGSLGLLAMSRRKRLAGRTAG